MLLSAYFLLELISGPISDGIPQDELIVAFIVSLGITDTTNEMEC